MNKYNIINTGDYLLIVDESEIKEGDWIKWNDKCLKAVDTSYLPTTKKIIAHLPLNGSLTLEGVDLLPPLEDDIEKLASNHIDANSGKWSNNTNEVGDNYASFIEGYKKAKEKYKYTEEDMIKCWKYASIDKIQIFGDQIGDSYMSFIQSLQQPKMPVMFKCEIQHYYLPSKEFYHDASFVQCTKEQYDSIKKEIPSCPLKKEIKTTTNSQGLTEWVGEYSFDDKK